MVKILKPHQAIVSRSQLKSGRGPIIVFSYKAGGFLCRNSYSVQRSADGVQENSCLHGGFCMKKAFTLVEILIVTAILGIMAAIVMPIFGEQVQLAKEAAAKDNLRVLRNVIERYAAEHNDVPPGYSDNDPSKTVSGPLPDFNCDLLTIA